MRTCVCLGYAANSGAHYGCRFLASWTVCNVLTKHGLWHSRSNAFFNRKILFSDCLLLGAMNVCRCGLFRKCRAGKSIAGC